jgi:hypothetical protein
MSNFGKQHQIMAQLEVSPSPSSSMPSSGQGQQFEGFGLSELLAATLVGYYRPSKPL